MCAARWAVVARNNNRTQVSDKRGYAWAFSFDSNGNVLTAKDPYLNTYTLTWSSHNKLLTLTIPTGEEAVASYDTHDNLTGVAYKDKNGVQQASVSYTVNSYGERTDYYDANNHHYQYGYSTNGDLTSVTTPKANVTSWTRDALGMPATRTDAMNRQTSYSMDAWERISTITYPDNSTHTFQWDADSDLTQFVDGTGTTTRAYDSVDRITSESKGGSTIVSYSWDGTGEKGLLSSLTDSGSRTIGYSYTARDELYQVTDSAGTATYSYDPNSDETGVTLQNGATVAESYDNASRLTGVTNKSGSTVLSSCSYTLDTDGRRTAASEADGSAVNYGYDWGSRLTSEVRTGTSPYNYSYTVDAAGNRTGETLNGTSTSFTLDSDDELTSTSGGIVNSYGYDANGEQTSRTLSGTAYTLAFDYDGQLTSITQGASVTSFTYDALGRRVSRTAGGTTTSFQLTGNVPLLEKQGSTTTATYTAGNELLRKDGEYPLSDGLGSERTVTNSSQTVTGTVTCDAFRNTVGTTGLSTDPYMFGGPGWAYRNDRDAGLTLVGARYYDAQTGAFITRDTDLSQAPYLYAGGDPVNAVDPSGHQSLGAGPPPWWGAIGGWIAGLPFPGAPLVGGAVALGGPWVVPAYVWLKDHGYIDCGPPPPGKPWVAPGNAGAHAQTAYGGNTYVWE